MEAILYIKKQLLTMSLHFILATLLIDFCLFVEKSNAVFDGRTPRDRLLSFLPPGLDRLHSLRSLILRHSMDTSDPQLHACHQQGITRGAAWVDDCHAGILTR